jgi:hypothetical protein
LGAIGSCGRELCCSTWLTDFRSVATSAARYQQLSLNPLKLAGQCGKLKCCLNYELDSYMDALKDFPEVNNVKLETVRGRAFHQKTDIFRRTMFFSYTDEPDNFIPLTVDRVKEVMEMNKNGVKPEDLSIKVIVPKIVEKKPDYENVVGQDSLTRFDQKKKSKKNKKKNDQKQGGGNAQGKQQQGQKQNQQGNKQQSSGSRPNQPNQKQNTNQQGGKAPQQQGQKQQGQGQQRNRQPKPNRPKQVNQNNNKPPQQM